ncbi:hypothetical protein [Gilliamella apicola]|nr:hypothetical protein [Gilliamella apicola]
MKLRVTKCGCYGRIDGEIAELPVGHEFTAKEIPPAFVGRVIVLEQGTKPNTPPKVPLIVIVNGEEVNLANMSGKDLAEFAKQHELTSQQSKETVPNFAKRLKEEFEAKSSGTEE